MNKLSWNLSLKKNFANKYSWVTLNIKYLRIVVGDDSSQYSQILMQPMLLGDHVCCNK